VEARTARTRRERTVLGRTTAKRPLAPRDRQAR
jgi:hypothetical protein